MADNILFSKRYQMRLQQQQLSHVCNLLRDIVEVPLVAGLPLVRLPPVVIRLVSEPPRAQPRLQLAEVAPALVVLQPHVDQRLLHRVALALLHLQTKIFYDV